MGVGAVVGRRQPVRSGPARPAGAVNGADRQRPELVESEAPVREPGRHVLDPVELGVLVRVGGLLPGPGPLEGDLAFVQGLTQPSRPIATMWSTLVAR